MCCHDHFTGKFFDLTGQFALIFFNNQFNPSQKKMNEFKKKSIAKQQKKGRPFETAFFNY